MSFLAVIFDPVKDQKKEEFVGALGLTNLKPPVYPLSIQFPANGKLLSATSQTGKNGAQQDIFAVQKFDNLFFRPSANLDIDSQKWGFAVNDLMVKIRLESGALEVVHPEKTALEREEMGVGYHMYSEPNALKLVKYTNDLGSLRAWAVKEERKGVITALDAQYKAVERHLEKLKAG